jgi:hypothetical protein
VPYEELLIDDLRVNRANDRHGELENETAAIAELFHLHDVQMRQLARDIAREQRVFEAPLVWQDQNVYIVFDGNRRVTCLKLLRAPERAPTVDLQQFFRGLRADWEGDLPDRLVCQVEQDRELIDSILFRRHTGSQGGVGQLTWNPRAKLTFVERTGRGGRVDVAVEVERLLAEEDRLPVARIPWTTLRRLLSSEDHRGRAGVSTAQNQFRLTHERAAVVDALARITDDLASGRVTLGDLWDNRGKRTYLNRLEQEGVLPTEEERLPQPEAPGPRRRGGGGRRPRPAPPQTTLIPVDVVHIQWTGDQHRIRAIWEELQNLELARYPNAISALLRILLELAVESYIVDHEIAPRNTLAQRVGGVADHLLGRDLIDQAYRDELERMRQHNELISVASMQRLLHSQEFAPIENELRAYWARLGRFLIACVSR